MQILGLKTATDFAASEVPEGQVLVWPEKSAGGVVLRYKTSDGTVGVIAGGGSSFWSSVINAELTRGSGGSGGPGAWITQLEPAAVLVEQSIIFDYNQSIL